MDLPLIPHLPAELVARSPDPQTIYYSNPDWAVDDGGPLLLWDTFGAEYAIDLARPGPDGWRSVAHFPGAMHSHLIDLPEQHLTLVVGVMQTGRPRAIVLWWSRRDDDWHGPIELFGAADYHAGSTPWAVYEGRLYVPFEIQQSPTWGSYQYGCIHADLKADLRRPGSWTLTQNRVPWTVFPGAENAGALEGNLVVAPDGRLYNLLRIPEQSRLGRAVWSGAGWEWLGLVQGVHNQSKPEVFHHPGSGRWYLLANGWPGRVSASIGHACRNALCLWEATEADLSRWRLVRVIASDRDPRHAFSYVAAIVDGEDTLWIAERHGDDETRNFHDTNCIVVRRIESFGEWVAAPGLLPYGHDHVDQDGHWRKSNPQDGLLFSHLDGAMYPLTLSATVRFDRLPQDVGALDLLGFATCDLVSIAAVQLVEQGDGPQLAVSAGGRRVVIGEPPSVGGQVAIELQMVDPAEVTVTLDGALAAAEPAHIAADPSVAGVTPRADRPRARLGEVTYLAGPQLTAGFSGYAAPELPDPWILVDGRGVTGTLPGGVPMPVDNSGDGTTLVTGGHAGFFEPWAGGILSGPGCAALWAPLNEPPTDFTMGGFVRLIDPARLGTVVLAAFGERTSGNALRPDYPYLALLLRRESNGPALAVAWHGAGERMVAVVGPVEERVFFTLAADGGETLKLTVYRGVPDATEPVGSPLEVPRLTVAGARHWLALIGESGGEVRAAGGLFVCRSCFSPDQVAAIACSGYALKMDSWPSRAPTCCSSAGPDRAG